MSGPVTNIPNVISSARLVCAPVLLAVAWEGTTGLFLALFGAGLLSDVLDGALARRFKLESDFGARLDQWADFALWLSFPIGAWWLWPDLLRREATYVLIAIVCAVSPTALAYLKYRAVPGYHTWSVKGGAVLMGIAVPLLLLFEVAWPFRIAALFQIVCAVDELGITMLLPTCQHDIPSLFHAARMRRGWTPDRAPRR